MGGRGYKNDVSGYLNGNRRTIEFKAAFKSPDGKIDILYDVVSPKAPTMPVFSNTEGKIYAIVGKNGDIKSIGFYNDKHILEKSIHLDHDDGLVSGPHVHIGDSYHHISGLSRSPSKEENEMINYIRSLWAKTGGKNVK